MDFAGLVTALIQLGCGVAALKLAHALKYRVDDHEVRLSALERR